MITIKVDFGECSKTIGGISNIKELNYSLKDIIKTAEREGYK